MTRLKAAMQALARIEARVLEMSDEELDIVEERGIDVFFRTYLKILIEDENERRSQLTAHQKLAEFRKRNRNRSGR